MTFTGWLRIYLSLLVVGAVFYSFTGPLLDHHFTERIPYHGHVYLSGLPESHVHLYDRPHAHDDASPGSSDILFLPDQDAQYGPDGFAGWQWLSAPWLILLPTLLTLLIGWRPQRRLLSAFLSPPDKPPRLFA